MSNRSGMNTVANECVIQEQKLGIEAVYADFAETSKFEQFVDADIHVAHTHFPDAMRKMLTKPLKLVWVAHGGIDHVFYESMSGGLSKGYGAGDGWMLCQYWLQHSDAIITYWPRQAAIWQTLCDKNTKVHCVPMGVEKSFWKPVQSRGRYQGLPSLLTAENSHYCKWPYDLFVTWPMVYPELDTEGFLHAIYLPTDQHRWFFPLMSRNGCYYRTVPSALILPPEDLRNAFCSTDYYIGLVRYGDFNRVCLEANASGSKTISYRGNPYSDFWITEGDQRVMAQELTAILKGQTEPRQKDIVPEAVETSKEMIKVYEGIL
jgi:hypothetical protein